MEDAQSVKKDVIKFTDVRKDPTYHEDNNYDVPMQESMFPRDKKAPSTPTSHPRQKEKLEDAVPNKAATTRKSSTPKVPTNMKAIHLQYARNEQFYVTKKNIQT
uniref:AlNc14C328G10661 protein n=1 Tax=Albugo laibachii Nc14 TaxID=890382 RepID=F0WWP8_9STRA|nr:AlNc14C328G10661 [Albugo laibachii Nc14]|eukprot:CCA25874.1 AlNc14C328G10661 [Albugo laibachii Nc14]